MTELEFWVFLRQKGKADMLMGSIDSGNGVVQGAAEYINGHMLLPKNYENLSEHEIVSIGELLFQPKVERKTKMVVLILLAHQVSMTALAILTRFNMNPDKEVELFAKFAIEESLMWNEQLI